MRVFNFVDDLDVVQLDVQELIDRFESSPNGDVILKLNGHLMVDESLEKTERNRSVHSKRSCRILGMRHF